MNIHYPQVESRGPLPSHRLAALAILLVLVVALSLSRQAIFYGPAHSVSLGVVQAENRESPIAIPAPLPPVARGQANASSDPAREVQSSLVPQALPAPRPSVP